MRTENGENEREGVRSGLRHRIVEELNGRRETGDEELLEIIDLHPGDGKRDLPAPQGTPVAADQSV